MFPDDETKNSVSSNQSLAYLDEIKAVNRFIEYIKENAPEFHDSYFVSDLLCGEGGFKRYYKYYKDYTKEQRESFFRVRRAVCFLRGLKDGNPSLFQRFYDGKGFSHLSDHENEVS